MKKAIETYGVFMYAFGIAISIFGVGLGFLVMDGFIDTTIVCLAYGGILMLGTGYGATKYRKLLEATYGSK